MRLLARAAVVAGSALAAMVLSIGPLLAAAGTGSVTTAPSAESWYRSAPGCASSVSCAALPTPYPSGTFHVGVTAGMEDSRSFLQLDLTRLPAGTKPTGGQLRLPLGSASDGTMSPETAKLRACLATTRVGSDDGTVTSEPPKADCGAAAVDAVFVPAAGSIPAAFTVDLAALASAWQAAAAPGALALVPADTVAQTDQWHLAFSKHDRRGVGVFPPTAAISYTAAAVDTEAVPPPLVTAPVQAAPPYTSGPASTTNLSAADQTVLSAPAPTVADQQAAVVGRPPAKAVVAPAAAPVAFTTGDFRYPAVFLLPLLLALAIGWLGRAFTRELRPS